MTRSVSDEEMSKARNNKAYIWQALILTIVTAFAVVILGMGGADRNAFWINNVLIAYITLVIVIMMLALHRQLKQNVYSYNTIYYIGFAIFMLSVLITHIVLAVKIANRVEIWSGQYFMQIISGLCVSAERYMIISMPFILIIAILLFTSNVSLIRHEGARFANTLGIILSVLLIGGEALILFGDWGVSGSTLYVLIHDIFVNVFAAGYLYFECMVIGVMITQIVVSKMRVTYDRDFVIILGCGIRKDGTPLPLLRDRIDRATAFRNEQLRETGKRITFVPTGGQGSDEVISESESISRYLIEQGIPQDEILKEDRSTSTLENMKFSKKIISEQSMNAKVAFATTNYHVFRSGMLASKVGMLAVGVGAKSKWYFWPNALVREFVGLLVERKKSQILIITTLIVIYIILTLLYGLFL